MNFKLTYHPACDDTVDSEWRVTTLCGVETGISIQDCRSYGGGFAVNDMPEGASFMLHLGHAKTLKDACDIVARFLKVSS
jgi:hypothetical protein